MKLPELIPGRIKCHYGNLASIAPINIIKLRGRFDHHHLAAINPLSAQEPQHWLHLC